MTAARNAEGGARRPVIANLFANAVFALLCVSTALAADSTTDPLAWPPATQDCRPWSYWWWLGSAVDKENLTKELTRYHEAGWGGVHIIPIYGAKGWEGKFIDYLSPKWMEMLKHTVTEAQRLGLGVDMTTGTGWCFGGPNVTEHDACAQAVAKVFEVAAGGKLQEKLDPNATQALVAFDADGKCLELTDRVTANNNVDWTAGGQAWRVYAISQKPSSKVKRAAPGGEGWMLNPSYADAIRHWLPRFTAAFAGYDGPKPRAQYHDSFEYGVNWSPDLFAQFEKRRGYRLQTELPALLGKETSDHVARVKCDYRETMSDMMIEDSMPVWFNWCREHGFLTRNQAHGSPGNLLDLYALADIPETEMFHTDRRPLVSKFASSAAHIAGRKLVASETGTWLKEHFTETLADVQGLLDDLFVSGINHIIFHGTCYSPDQAPWPGWLFYASTEMNPRNSIWRDVPALAAYIARCQSVLQAGEPDNDVLVYWPIHDTWHDAQGTAMGLSIHGARWFGDKAIGKVAEKLWACGFTFDYVSDRQLAGTKAANGTIAVPGGRYRAVVVPACDHMPLASFERLVALADAGATVIFEDHLPTDVPGLGDLEHRRAELKKLLARISERQSSPPTGQGVSKTPMVGKDIELLLTKAGVTRESLVDHSGLLFIRRSFEGGRHYFIANRGEQPLSEWVPLATKTASVAIMDAMTGHVGIGALRQSRDGTTQAYLQLQPGESVILRAFAALTVKEPAWVYWQPAGQPVELSGSWRMSFIAGGPTLPPPFESGSLASWTELGGEEAQRFAGTARYSLKFDAPAASADGWWLDLGRVCQSARVRLNGRDLGTTFLPPFRLRVDELKPTGNELEIEVTNTSANRIRDIDRRGVKWRSFYDINFVNIDYKPFDASNWPLADSGLLGPVLLRPVARVATN
jgi:hypothetical protein